jgi:hypothetical protein
MTLAEATAQWLEATARDDSVPQEVTESRALSLALLAKYFGADQPIDEFTPARLRDFLARWFIENTDTQTYRVTVQELSIKSPDIEALVDSLTAFIRWMAPKVAIIKESEYRSIIVELRDRLPRAIAISAQLSKHLAERGGAFGFAEFLTSFEAGGHSAYDLDTPGESGCVEGYFRILRVAGNCVEAKETISESRLWPILFPDEVAELLAPDYLINLELIHAKDMWQIAACGFAYPPGTEV